MYKNGLSYSISPLDFTDAQINSVFLKQQLVDFQAWSVAEFKQNTDIEQLVGLRSQFIDKLLERLWLYYQIPSQVSFFLKQNRIALIAVGGYGRSELHPLSDIDILILSDKPLTSVLEQQVGALVRLLWDLHLDVGHSVRTLKMCLQEAKDDISTMTNLIESRLISGNKSLFKMLREKIFSNKIWPSALFYRAKIEEQHIRHKQYRSTSYNLEPDLKNSPGNLRDIHTIKWIAIRNFECLSIEEITQFNYLTLEEIEELKACQRFLWRMRFVLHSVITRYDNRLLFDRQLNIAKMLGYQGEGNTPVESMMHDYYRVAHNITELNHMLLQRFDESILMLNPNRKTYDINEYFQIKGNLINIKDNQLFEKEPTMLVTIFYTMLMNDNIKGIHSNTVRQLRLARKKLPYLLSEDPKARQVFMLIIKHPNAIRKAILPMHRYGILAVYLPDWKNISGMMQFDLFHIYTVDEHTIRLLLELDSLKTKEGRKMHPNSSNVFSTLSKPELLVIAGLFHDIAKGQHGDHSEQGAQLAKRFCQLHDIEESDTSLIVWLVRYHLLMSVTAQNRDLQDPAVIREFAQKVKSKRCLQYLLCLTVADVCATNETLWNSWKQSLLRELYFTAERSFDLGIHQIPKQRSVAHEHKKMALTILLKQGHAEQEVKAFWQDYRFDYFLRYTTEQIVWHANHLLSHDLKKIQILINPSPSHGGTEVFVYAPDRPYLFAVACNELSNHNLNIHDSLIYTNKKGFALDTFIVLEPNGQIVAQDRHYNIRQKLKKALMQTTYKKMPSKPLKQRMRSFSVPTQVNFLSTLSYRKTYMEVIALDRPGLLACLAEVFVNLDLSLRSAKIATIGERVEDLFILTDKNNQALNDDTCYELREATITAIDSMN